jgi:hypothetical protein
MLTAIEELLSIHRISVEGGLQISLEAHRWFISHFHPVLQNASGELVTRVTSQPQPEVRVHFLAL